MCYAVSEDGIEWEKPSLGLVEFEGDTGNNIVLRGPHGSGILRDAHDADPSRRYKAFYHARRFTPEFKRGPMSVRFSADGHRWGDEIPCPEIDAAGDTHNNAFWCVELERYVGITRLSNGPRLVGRTESLDFVHWTKASEVLRGDEENETYAMIAFPYAGVYLGLVMIIHIEPCRVECELAWSPDTIEWHWVDRGTPLIPNSTEKGVYDWGCVYAAAYPVVSNEAIRLYYGASNDTHSGWRDGCLALATLRPDGFAGYKPVDPQAPAVVRTRPVSWDGDLRITADAAGGSVRVHAFDDAGNRIASSTRVVADVTDAPVRFDGAVGGQGLREQVVLEFELKRSRLYAFSVGGANGP